MPQNRAEAIHPQPASKAAKALEQAIQISAGSQQQHAACQVHLSRRQAGFISRQGSVEQGGGRIPGKRVVANCESGLAPSSQLCCSQHEQIRYHSEGCCCFSQPLQDSHKFYRKQQLKGKGLLTCQASQPRDSKSLLLSKARKPYSQAAAAVAAMYV